MAETGYSEADSGVLQIGAVLEEYQLSQQFNLSFS